MKTAVISFTDAASVIADRICSKIENTDIYNNKDHHVRIKAAMASIFESYDRIIFVCASGIAVRMIAPYIKDKTKDPAVVVVDDMGKFAISLLSGHIGGANELTFEIAMMIGAQPVITTASDGRGIESVDMFAKRCSLLIEDMEEAKKLTSIMVNGGTIGFISETEDKINYKNISETNLEGCIYVTSKENIDCAYHCCILRPRNLIVGVGCRRGKTKDDILSAICHVFKSNNLSIKSIKTLASIDIKKDEKGIIETCKYLDCSFTTFSKEAIKSVQDKFEKSAFVESKVEVTSVCEPSAYLAGGDIVVGKTCLNGVTVAVGRVI